MILPLMYRSEVVGVLEVAASEHAIGAHLAELEVVAGQMAIVLSSLGMIHASSPRMAGSQAEIPGLLHGLLVSSSRQQAVVTTVRFLWDRMGVPVAGWLGERDGRALRLVAARGVTREMKDSLRRGSHMADSASVVTSGGHILGGVEAIVTGSGDAVVLVKSVEASEGHLLEMVEAGLGLALERAALSEAVTDLVGSIDEGLAWTAHELRGPLLGIEKALEGIVTAPRSADLDHELLEDARAELHRLTDMVDEVLRWSVGAASIRSRPTDLTELVKETVGAPALQERGRRLIVHAPSTAVVDVDPQLLRIAIENLIRNALQHARDDIEVAVEMSAREATVSVSDAGPGVPSDERATIFEPFMRGRHGARGGRGLGLFIAHRVMQAHGGMLWLETASTGSVFRMRFPRSAS